MDGFRTTGGIPFEWKCPFGMVGDRLWVRSKTFIRRDYCDWQPHRYNPVTKEVIWCMNGTVEVGPEQEINEKEWKRVSAIHMPRWACRTWLEITEVRVQRVQEITSEDCLAEGVSGDMEDGSFDAGVVFFHFIKLWDSINGPGRWEANPWVWVVTFRKVAP